MGQSISDVTGTSRIATSVDKAGDNLTDIATTGITTSGDVLQEGIGTIGDVVIDTERSIVKGLNNVVSDVTYTGRFVGKNGMSLLDNMQDNAFQMVQDIKSDITSTVQVGIMIFATMVGVGMILWGDKIIDKGINFSGINVA